MLKGLVVAAVALAAIGTAVAEDSSAAELAPAHVAKWMTTPCAAEDSSNCYWDAGSTHNGHGHSWYAVCIDHHRVVIYWQHKYNLKHGYVTKGCNR